MPLSRLPPRRLWLRAHLAVALGFGLLLALIGLSGSLCLYGDELDRLFNPGLTVEPHGDPRSLDELMSAVRRAHPDYAGPWTLELPRSPTDPLTAWYEKPLETLGQPYAPLMVAVNPYTAEVLASRLWGQTARSWLLQLHSQLHLGRRGWRLVGSLGLLLAFSAASGLYLWWPGFRRLPQAFRFRTAAGLACLSVDVHRWLGLLGSTALLMLGLTGFGLAYPGVGETLVGTSGMGHGDDGPSVRSTGQAMGGRPVGLAEAVLLARGPFPRSDVRLVTTPDGPEGTYRITFRQPAELNDRHPMTAVWIDPHSGQIREVRNALRFGPGETALTAIWPLHTGELLGGWGRFAWFLAGLALPILYVTGLLRWLIARGSVPDRPVAWVRGRRLAARARLALRHLIAGLGNGLMAGVAASRREGAARLRRWQAARRSSANRAPKGWD